MNPFDAGISKDLEVFVFILILLVVILSAFTLIVLKRSFLFERYQKLKELFLLAFYCCFYITNYSFHSLILSSLLLSYSGRQ